MNSIVCHCNRDGNNAMGIHGHEYREGCDGWAYHARPTESGELDGRLLALAVENALRGDKIGKSKRKHLQRAFDIYRGRKT
jgi:hypothetical protein